MFNAWNDGKREVTTDDVLKSIETINPMAEGMMKGQVDALREYSKTACIRRANGNTVPTETAGKPQRVIRNVG